MVNSVDNKVYNFIGELSIALYSQGIRISLDALKQILIDRGEHYSEDNNRGLGQSVSAAYHAWEEVDPVVHHSIAYTFQGRDGEFSWKNN